MTTTKKERYLKLKHDLLENCGQCMGFRAKGIDITADKPEAPCVPSMDCHKTCPAMGLGKATKDNNSKKELQNNLYQLMTSETKPVQEKEQPQEVLSEEQGNLSYVAQSCYACGRSEDEGTLLPCRYKGKSLWVCTKCLPALIHG